MKTIEYHYIDKSTWGDGPWQTEPDKVQFQDEATGLPCLVVRGPVTGAWCGYVGITEGHPEFGKDYHEIKLPVGVHGGLTFSDFAPRTIKNMGSVIYQSPGNPIGFGGWVLITGILATSPPPFRLF